MQAWREAQPEYAQKGPVTGQLLQEMILAQDDDLHRKTTTLALQETRQAQVIDRLIETVC